MAANPNDTQTPHAPLKAQPPTGNNAKWDEEDKDERPDGDPASVKNEGPLESLGKAISSPVLESEEDPKQPGKKAAADKR